MLFAFVYCKRYGKLVAAVRVGVDVKRTPLGYLCPSVLSLIFDVKFSILTESYSFQFLVHNSFNSFNSCSFLPFGLRRFPFNFVDFPHARHTESELSSALA